MFTHTKVRRSLAALVATAGMAATAFAAPVGTSFTYQGLLENAGTKVTSTVNVDFRLFDAASGGTQRGGTISQMVTPDEGVFSATLDFGAGAFAMNEALWLEITVEGETLDRQKLESAPFALNTRGLNVGTNGDASVGGRFTVGGRELFFPDFWDIGAEANNFFSINETNVAPRLTIVQGGNVGIGTTAPTSALSVDGTADFAGNVGIGTSSPSQRLDVQGNARIAGGLFMDNPNAVADIAGRLRLDDNTHRIGPTSFGNVALTIDSALAFGLILTQGDAGKPGGGSWANTSDRRLKKNIESIDNALETVLALKGVTYEYKDAEAVNELPGERIGFIAQDVEAVIPDWISEHDDGYKRMTIRGFEALSVEAFREQQAQIDALEAEIESLKGGATVLRSSLAWPVVIGGALFAGLAVARRRQPKA
ncbi:MAG: tail fiber domain-containing protein [Planctomycetota bacterium]